MSPPILVLEAATADDLDTLLELERRSYTHPWTRRNFRDAIADPGQALLVLRNPLAGGSQGLVAYCCFQVVADEMHLHNLAVDPDHHRRGLGRRLLGLALELAARRGARRALLEVREGNRAARELYAAAGFRTLAVRLGYYAEPVEDALVLEKEGLAGLAADD